MQETDADHAAAVASAIRAISTEQAGVAALAAAFGNGLAQPFGRAVALLRKVRGRVIVTGVGKSGHIGAKIAATLASTGTPAFFVHSAEANHGDLGMITREDAILALSWTGESSELKGIVTYSRRFEIPLIALTSGEASSLGREAVATVPADRAAMPTSCWRCRVRRKPARMAWRQPLRRCCNS